MRIIIQRVTEASVTVDQQIIGSIGQGVLLLVGFTDQDTEADLDYMVEKIINLRIFEDSQGKMNLSLADIKGELLSVPQFTLYADCRKGRRPSFINAARPETAIPMYEQFNKKIAQSGLLLQTGQFGADMKVALINDGPVTIMLDSQKIF